MCSMSPAKMAELIEMPFGMWTRLGPRKHLLDVGPRPSGEEAFWGTYLQ